MQEQRQNNPDMLANCDSRLSSLPSNNCLVCPDITCGTP
jgi:hypothetical protein